MVYDMVLDQFVFDAQCKTSETLLQVYKKWF